MWGGLRSGREQRGASEVLGAIFVFAILIAAVGAFQVTIVPQTNEEVEFKHSTQVRSDMTDLRAAMVSTGTDGGRRTVSVRTGVDYPSRSVTINPPSPRGRLSTSSEVTGAVELQSVTATDPEAGDYWNGTATFDTKFVAYQPSYNYYDGAPVTRYEPTVVYSAFRDSDVVETPQSLVDGRTLNLVLVSGSLSQSGGATETVDVVPVSSGTDAVTITDPGPLLVKTHLSKAAWQTVLNDEPDATFANYTNNTDAPNVVNVSLATGEWNLRVSEVGTNSGGSASAAYLTAESPTARSIESGTTADLTVAVRDRYGNPVAGQNVSLNRSSGTVTKRTGSDGTVTFEVDPSSSTTLAAYLGSGGSVPSAAEEKVLFDVNVIASGGGSQSDINPAQQLFLKDTYFDDSGNNNTVTLTFENTGTTSANITDTRVALYALGCGSCSLNNREGFNYVNTSYTPQMTVGGEYEPFSSSEIPAGNEFVLHLKFYEDSAESTPAVVELGDWFILRVKLESGTTNTYFISIKRIK